MSIFQDWHYFRVRGALRRYPQSCARILAIFGSLSFFVLPAQNAWALNQTSWGVVAADGGLLVDVEVGAQGSIKIVKSVCPGRRIKKDFRRPHWRGDILPSPGSRLTGILTQAGGRETFVVPDIGWTRWALDLSPRYLAALCRVAAGEADPSRELRVGWRDLLTKIDQRARDEASRLAFEFPAWAKDVSEEELTNITQQISVFPVPEEEALRWFVFFRRIPPGSSLLAFLEVAEGSEKPFFKTFLRTYSQLKKKDGKFIRFCEQLTPGRRPEICSPLVKPTQ